MPLEDCRNIYLGVTPNHIHAYLGKASADLAGFFYERVGIEFHTEKTGIALSVNDFSYLVNVGAAVFKRKPLEEVVRDLNAILDAYNVFRENGFKLPDHVTRTSEFLLTEIYNGLNKVLYNKAEKVAIYVAKTDLPEYTADSIITCQDWMAAANYMHEHMEQVTITGDRVVHLMCNMFHRQKFEYHELNKKLCAFQDLYINMKVEKK